MNERYIVTSGGLYGHFGSGSTLDEAKKNWRKAGGLKREGNYREQKFVSEMPFAPANRQATKEEADCWIGQDGSTNWVGCERIILTKEN